MSQSAQVTSIQTLVDFRAGLCTFGADAREIVTCIQTVLLRPRIGWRTRPTNGRGKYNAVRMW